MPKNSKEKLLTLTALQAIQVEALLKSQDGILGIPLVGIPEVTNFIFAGWYFNGIPLKICNSNKIITLPGAYDGDPTDIMCEIEGEEHEVRKYSIALNTRIQITSSRMMALGDLYPTAKTKSGVCSATCNHNEGNCSIDKLDPIEDIKRELEKMAKFIEHVIKKCDGNPSCVFDKVWAQLVRQLCGGDCARDCNIDYNCGEWDIICIAKRGGR